MEDWVKLARELQLKDELSKQHTKPGKNRAQEILDSEQDWRERVAKRVLEIAAQGVHILIDRTPNGLELHSRAMVDIQFLGHENFAIKYHHISKPSTIRLNRPIRIYHHRLARVRELNNHNIEAILRFAALGMEQYLQTASFQRIEHNLEMLIDAVNQDEHVEGPEPRDKTGRS